MRDDSQPKKRNKGVHKSVRTHRSILKELFFVTFWGAVLISYIAHLVKG